MIPYADRKEAIRAVLKYCAMQRQTVRYGVLGRAVGIPAQGPWKPVLDEISREEKLDITFLEQDELERSHSSCSNSLFWRMILSEKSATFRDHALVVNKDGLSSQIDFKEAKPATDKQKKQAADTIEAVFAHYSARK